MYNFKIMAFALWLLLGFQFIVFAQKDTSAIKKLSRGADVILTGKVTQTQSNWNATKTRIFTQVTLEVEEFIKGSENEAALQVIYPGGEVGEVGELYSHMPQFKESEEVLVFLKKDKHGNVYKVLYGESGKLTLLKDEKSGETVTTSNISLNSLKAAIKGFLQSDQ